MRLSLVAIVLAACGGGTTAAPARPVAREHVAPPARPTCAEIGVILRGVIDVGDDKAGPERERAIEAACVADHWASAVIECAASTVPPTECLTKLDDVQRSGYETRLRAWATKWGASDPDLPASPAPPPPVACAEALHAPDLIAPPLDDADPEHAWSAAQRLRILTESCERDPWTEELKTCLRDATSASDTQACTIDMSTQSKLAEVRVTAAAIAKVRGKPKQLGCAQVVAHHYADARWPGTLGGLSATDRKKVIAAARDAMRKACEANTWDETLRACVVADGGDPCFAGTQMGWSLPPGDGMGPPTVDCFGFAALMQRAAACERMPDRAREALRMTHRGLVSQDDPADAAKACTRETPAVIEILKQYGC